MDDISILLNLTDKVAFERTDPLMDLVCAHGPYLFYDQLSVERFPLVKEEQERYVARLLARLRNLLESRRLSAEDKGGRIRLHILLDLIGEPRSGLSATPPLKGVGKSPAPQLCFPAQKVKRFVSLTANTFKHDRQLLSRFDYCFIFMHCDADDKELSDFYCALAYDGWRGAPGNWLSEDDFAVNKERDGMIEELGSPPEEMELTDSRVRDKYAAFRQTLQQHIDRVATRLALAGVDTMFRNMLSEACGGIKTVGDLRDMDFDGLLCTSVSRLIGLQYAAEGTPAPALRPPRPSEGWGNFSFIIFKHRTGTDSQRRADETVLTSLLQLLGTMDDDVYKKVMGTGDGSGRTGPKLFVIDGKANTHFTDVRALSQLKKDVNACLPKFSDNGSLSWTKDKTFTYREYSAKNAAPSQKDDYKELNDKIKKQREALTYRFQELRKVPFFFGKRPGDWEWYNNVTSILDEIFAFETTNDRPLFSPSRRIREKEMDVELKEDSYVAIKEKRDKLREMGKRSGSGSNGRNPIAEMKDYLRGRHAAMDNLEQLNAQVKTEMVRLGMASSTSWIAFLISLLITICFAFHFIYTGYASSASFYISAAFVAAFATTGLAAVIAWSRIKRTISDTMGKIHFLLTTELHGKQEAYLQSINKHITKQNEADIWKKNLDELEEKLSLFDRHNMQIDLWQEHFVNMKRKLDADATRRMDTDDANTVELKVNDNDFDTDDMPALPDVVCSHFRSMETVFSSQQHIKNVTCFLKRIEVTIIQESA